MRRLEGKGEENQDNRVSERDSRIPHSRIVTLFAEGCKAVGGDTLATTTTATTDHLMQRGLFYYHLPDNLYRKG